MLPLEEENRDLEDPTTRRQRGRQKTIGLRSKTTTLYVCHTFFYISLPFMHTYDLKMPNCAFLGERKQARRTFLSLSDLGYGPLEFNFRRVRLHLTK